VSVLERLGDGDHELVCHPGLAVGEVPEDPGWRYDWDDELAALTSDRARRVVERRGIQLVTWKDLG